VGATNMSGVFFKPPPPPPSPPVLPPRSFPLSSLLPPPPPSSSLSAVLPGSPSGACLLPTPSAPFHSLTPLPASLVEFRYANASCIDGKVDEAVEAAVRCAACCMHARVLRAACRSQAACCCLHWHGSPCSRTIGGWLGLPACLPACLRACVRAWVGWVVPFISGRVVHQGKVCFDHCPQPLDKISDCYLVCYLNTLTGDPAYNLTKLPAAEFVSKWVGGFQEDDPTQGGCPSVTPLPCDNTWGQCPRD
jgi:hypothetical protein